MVMTVEKATKLGHDHVTCLEACFADIQQSFSCIFRIKDGMTLVNSAKLRWTKPKVMPQIIHYFTCYADANQLAWGLPFHCTSSSVADKSHVHTRIAQSVVVSTLLAEPPSLSPAENTFSAGESEGGSASRVGGFKIIFQDLILWTEMFIWLLVASGEIPKSQINTRKIKIFCAATLELVYKLLAGPLQKRKCFSEISR